MQTDAQIMGMIQAVDTRRLAKFESEFIPKRLRVPKTLRQLARKGHHIWKHVLNNRMEDFPELCVGLGRNNKSFHHWKKNYIEFVRCERNDLTLVHNLIHAHGREYHDPEFIFQEFRILTDVYNICHIKLSEAAERYELSWQPCLHLNPPKK